MEKKRGKERLITCIACCSFLNFESEYVRYKKGVCKVPYGNQGSHDRFYIMWNFPRDVVEEVVKGSS